MTLPCLFFISCYKINKHFLTKEINNVHFLQHFSKIIDRKGRFPSKKSPVYKEYRYKVLDSLKQTVKLLRRGVLIAE
jgi:hypothetical protein